MNFFEMLVMSRKLSFSDGRVTFYGQDIMIFPTTSLMDYFGLLIDDADETKEVYSAVKESMVDSKDSLKNAYNASDAVGWISNTVNLYGLGQITFSDQKAPIGEIIVTNSPFVESLKGKSKSPVDHVLRGIIAGLTSAVFDNDYDALETACRASGDQGCRFVLDLNANLRKNFPDIYKNQA